MTNETSEIRQFCFSGEDTPARLLAIWMYTNLTGEEVAEVRRMTADIVADGKTKASVEDMISIIEMAQFLA